MQHRSPYLAIAAVFFANGCGLGLWAAHIPVVMAGLALTKVELSAALLGMAAGALVAMPAVGRLVGRIGDRRCILVAGVAFGLLLATPLAAPSLPLLVVATFVLGIANGSLDVAQSTHGTHAERAAGRPLMSSLNGFFSLGGFSGAGIASLLLTTATPPALTLLGCGIALAALVLIAQARLVDVVETGDAAATGESGSPPASGPSLTTATLTLGALTFVAVLVEWAIMDWSAVYVVTVHATPASQGAIAFAAFCATMMLGRFTGDLVVARLGPRRVLILSGALVALGVAAATAAPDVTLTAAGFALAGFGMANLFPVLISAASRVPGIAAGRGVATVAAFAYTGGLLGPVVIGLGAHAMGLRATVAALAAGGVLLAVAGLIDVLGRMGLDRRGDPHAAAAAPSPR